MNNKVTLKERESLGHNNDAVSMIAELREHFSIQLKGSNQKSIQNAQNILSFFDANKKKVQSTMKRYSDWNLSFLNKDFYVLVRGGEVQMPLDYKAFARLAVQNARIAGYDLILEAGVIREGFKKGYILKAENGDENLVIANPMIGDIVSPWAKYKLISIKTHEIVSSLVEVVPQDEYQKAMSAGGFNGGVGQIHKSYATEGAKKIALRRVIKHLSYIFPNMQDLELVDNEQFNHDEKETTVEVIEQQDPLADVPKGLRKYES